MGKCYQLVSTHMPLSWTWGVWVHGSTVCKHTANAYVLMTLANNIQLALETKPDKKIRHDILFVKSVWGMVSTVCKQVWVLLMV